MLFALALSGCSAEPAPLSTVQASPYVVPSGRHLVGTINRVSDTELVLDVYGGPPPLVFVIRSRDLPNIDVPKLRTLTGRKDRIRVFYESAGDKDYVLRVEPVL